MIDKIFGALELFAPGVDLQEAWNHKEARLYLAALVGGILVCTLVSGKLVPSGSHDEPRPEIAAAGDDDELQD